MDHVGEDIKAKIAHAPQSTRCIAQDHVAEPLYSQNRGGLTVYVPNNTALTEAGQKLVNGFRTRFEAGESKGHYKHWTTERCESGASWVTDAGDGERCFALHTRNNFRLRMKASDNQPIDNAWSWGSSSPIVWLDPEHRYVATQSDSIYTLDPVGRMHEQYVTSDPEAEPLVL